MSTSKLKVGDKVSFKVNGVDHYGFSKGIVVGFTKCKVRVMYMYAGFEHRKVLFERNLTLI